MYILKVLVEHPTQSLDMPFDYLSNQYVNPGCRVKIKFKYQEIIGYVDDIVETQQTKEQLEKEKGFQYSYIMEVIDEKPLLNQELRELANYLSKLTLSPRISCLQCMLPPQLKPSRHHSTGIIYKTYVSFIKMLPVKTKKQEEALQYIMEHDQLPIHDYPYGRCLLDNLKKQGTIQYIQKEIYRDPYPYQEQIKEDYPLTSQQKYVVNQILSSYDQYQTFLLHGVTGSGKTEVYLQLSRFVIHHGKTVLMLVPEIALTPMMVQAFKSRFGKEVAILHSKLSSGERYDEYRRIVLHEVKIVVGARSAVFAPLENIGLIIMDEEHDASYKQESQPRYLTSQIAKKRGQYHHCPVVLGSATPSLESYSRALKGIYQLCVLPERINQNPLPQIELVDMVEEMKNHNYGIFSKKMEAEIQKRINQDEQILLLLNKRGYATFLKCNDCQEVIKCPHCDVTLTYHKATSTLRCHYCDFSQPVSFRCPHCQSTNMKMIGTGTQKVEEYLESHFLNARVIRYDVDSTRRKGEHEKKLRQFENQEANILLGTQMIAKGLDFENVTFVGVINADISLNVPDFRSNERTFQLLEQVAGRSGRGQKEGTVMIQT
ncbi:MAG: primosomal protein N', partial [Faecalibacillus sp.]